MSNDNWLGADLVCPCCGRDYQGDADLAPGDRCPATDCPGYGEDWYARRDELQPGDIMRIDEDEVVRLDQRVPGDGTDWYCDVWMPPVPGFRAEGYFSSELARHHPGDFTAKLPDNWAGENA